MAIPAALGAMASFFGGLFGYFVTGYLAPELIVSVMLGVGAALVLIDVGVSRVTLMLAALMAAGAILLALSPLGAQYSLAIAPFGH